MRSGQISLHREAVLVDRGRQIEALLVAFMILVHPKIS